MAELNPEVLALAALAELSTVKAELAALRKRERVLSADVKGWLAEHPSESLFDGELGITATLVERRKTQWDVRELADGVLLWARDNGLLDVNTSLFDEMAKRLGSGSAELMEVKKARHDGSTPTLIIEHER